MIGRSRIALKLLFAYGVMALLLATAAVIGLGGFQRIAETQDSVVERAVPALRDAHAVTELNSRISTIALGMGAVRSEPEQRAVNAELDRLMSSFAPLVASLQEQGIEQRFVAPVEGSVAELNEILGKRNLQLGNRIRLQQRLDTLSETVGEDLSELNQLADSLVANATARTTAVTASLYEMVESDVPERELYAVFDRLVEVDIDAMERTHELRQRSADLLQIVNQVVKEDRAEAVDEMQGQADGLLSILNRRIDEITDPQRKRRARILLNTINIAEGPGDFSSIFAARKALLSLERRLLRSEGEYNDATRRLDNIVRELSRNSSAGMTRATAAAQRSLTDNRQQFLITAVVLVALLALILWRYVHSDVVRRLLGLKDATLAIAGGKLDHPVDESGRDEISEMAQVLRLFRDNAVAKEQLDGELKRYKDNLEDTVRDRTLQLEQSNSRLADEVAQHDIARERAEQANQAKTDFLATISHELRTPLSGALGTLDLLEQTELSRPQREYLNTVNSANTLLLDILDNVLGYSQVRAGKIELHEKPFELQSLVKGIVDTMRSTADEKDVTLDFYIDEQLPDQLVGDSGKLNQILMNLVGNAVKFTHAGNVQVNVVLDAVEESSVHVGFSVTDNGIGIPEDRQAEMFKAFTQADTSISRKYGGVGLGLAICQRLTRLMGGKMAMQSESGSGTTVDFSLPFDIATDQRPPTDTRLPIPHLQLNVLLVEDDPTMVAVTTRYLESLGHAVVSAQDGETALEMLSVDVPDLVLLDISLPGIDGLGVLASVRSSVRSKVRKLPVLAMSAHVFEEEVASYLAAGMDGFIGKPFTVRQLDAAILRAVSAEGTEAFEINAIETDGNRSQVDAAADAVLLDESALGQDMEMLGVSKIAALLDLFEQNGTNYLEQLSDLEKSGNLIERGRVAHRMKSAAGNFGFAALLAALNQLEENRAITLHEIDALFYRSLEAGRAFIESDTGKHSV